MIPWKELNWYSHESFLEIDNKTSYQNILNKTFVEGSLYIKNFKLTQGYLFLLNLDETECLIYWLCILSSIVVLVENSYFVLYFISSDQQTKSQNVPWKMIHFKTAIINLLCLHINAALWACQSVCLSLRESHIWSIKLSNALHSVSYSIGHFLGQYANHYASCIASHFTNHHASYY